MVENADIARNKVHVWAVSHIRLWAKQWLRTSSYAAVARDKVHVWAVSPIRLWAKQWLRTSSYAAVARDKVHVWAVRSHTSVSKAMVENVILFWYCSGTNCTVQTLSERPANSRTKLIFFGRRWLQEGRLRLQGWSVHWRCTEYVEKKKVWG